MTNEVLNKLLAMPEILNRRNIRKPDGTRFQIRWMDRMIRDFEAVPTPVSITYSALIWLDGKDYEGEIEISRDGDLAVRIHH